MSDSSTGGYLVPSSGATADDANLEAIVQLLIAGVSGLLGAMVRPTWQVNIPKQPSPATNWCAIQIQAITPDDNPAIVHDPVAQTDTLYRHEEIDILLSFYGTDERMCVTCSRGARSCHTQSNSDAMTISQAINAIDLKM